MSVLQLVSDCGHDSRVVPLTLTVHCVSLHVHEFTCTWRHSTLLCKLAIVRSMSHMFYDVWLTEVICNNIDSKHVVLVNSQSICNSMEHDSLAGRHICIQMHCVSV